MVSYVLFTANGAGKIGKVQISLDFATGQRSIVTFRQVQATQGCESASMPRGGSESVRRTLALRSKLLRVWGFKVSAFVGKIICRGHFQTNVCGTFSIFSRNESCASVWRVAHQFEVYLIPSSKSATANLGGFLVRQPNGSICLQKARWQRLLLVLALLPAVLALNSCGGGSSSTTTTTPTITASCASSTLTVNGQTQCTANITNLSSTLVNWEAGGVAGGNSTFGTIDTNGKYTAPQTVPTNNVVTITAIAQAQTSLTATATITILPATAISAIDCSGSTTTSGLTVTSGMALACTATDSGGNPISVFWEVNTITGGNATIGKISAQGNYVAPLIPPAGGTVTITAVSQAVSTETKSVTVNVVFGNAVLQKAFAFSISGRLISGNTFFARAGSFIAGGDGTLRGVLEDYNQVGQPSGATQLAFTGTYSSGPDGRGTMEFCENINTACTPAAETAFFRIAVVSPQQAQIIEFSKPNSSVALKVGSGEMDSQDISVFNIDGLAGVYSFNFSGLSSLATSLSEVGEFSSNGHGTISAGSTNTPAKP